MADIRIFPTSDEVSAQAVEVILDAAREAIAARGRFTLAFTGGSAPKKTYSLLARPDRAGQIDWAKWFLFWGDDRFVPPDDDRSNFGMVSGLLLEHVPVPEANIYPVPVQAQNPAQAADYYADTLAQFFGIAPGGDAPSFDLILLGLGDDGHIASLFPGFPTLGVEDRWVVSSPPGTLPPPVDRVSLTYPVLNAARQVLFIVTGENKADAVGDILDSHAPRERRPGAGVHPAGDLIWLLDQAAASRLSIH